MTHLPPPPSTALPTTFPTAILAGLGSPPHPHTPPHTPPTPHTILQTHLIPSTTSNPLQTLQSLLDHSPNHHWLITLSYDLAPTIEPSVPKSIPSTTFPHIIAQQLTPHSPSPPSPHSSSSSLLPRASGGGAGASPAEGVFSSTLPKNNWSINPKKTHLIKKSHYISMVQKALDYIAAGDIYQVNLTHPITLPFAGSSKSLAQHLFNKTNPTMGSFTCFDTDPNTRHAIISLSPETFLTFDPATNTLTTEPMKGTSPATDDPQILYHSKKDRAELNMIIDLMRNDLAKVSTPGSVKVTNPRQITTHHNSVHQATATIQSTLNKNTTFTDILNATFPPGSITGAPKIRAMQIIHQLEQEPQKNNSPVAQAPRLCSSTQRGPYCGSTIHLTPNNAFTASVNIRTLHIQGTPHPASPDTFKDARLTYRTGAGIVADSIPEQEWQETLTKAAILKSTLNIPLPPLSPHPSNRQ